MTEQCNYHTHGHHKEKCCTCGCTDYSHEHDTEGSCHCAEKFLELADEAWKEVLKEKIKEKIIIKKAEHLDKLAEIVAKANGEKWKNIISSKMQCNEFKENIKEYFSSCD